MHFSYILPFISVFSQLALSRPQTLPAGTLVSTEDGTVEPLVPFTDDSNFEQVELKRADTSTNKRQHDITGPYYLKTSVLNGGDVHKDGLYVWAYHTGTARLFPLSLISLLLASHQYANLAVGAGLNDAVLGDKGKARPAYLNSTYQMFNLSGDSTPWTFFLPSNTNYAGKSLPSLEFLSLAASCLSSPSPGSPVSAAS